jgi:DNA-binding NarL/FixJ family response regulator
MPGCPARMVPVGKIRIVVADDNEDMLELLREIRETEFEVIAAVRDGRDLIRAVKDFKPDIVITDISMPELNGIDATRKIVEENLKAKIIILTVHTDQKIIDEGLSAGANGYVFKLAACRELGPAIHEIIGGNVYISSHMK